MGMIKFSHDASPSHWNEGVAPLKQMFPALTPAAPRRSHPGADVQMVHLTCFHYQLLNRLGIAGPSHSEQQDSGDRHATPAWCTDLGQPS